MLVAGCHDRSMRRWRRVGGWTARERVAAGLLTWGVALIAGATIMFVRHGILWRHGALLGLLGLYGAFAAWITFVWRLMRTGLYTSDTGIRVRWLLRTRTYAWSRLRAIDVAPAVLLGAPTSRAAIWLELVDGDRVETPVQRRAQRIPGLLVSTKNVGPVLRSDRFDRVVHDLEQRARAGSLPPPGPQRPR